MSRTRIINVIREMVGLIEVSARAVPPIRCMSRWPAVMLAVSRTASAMG